MRFVRVLCPCKNNKNTNFWKQEFYENGRFRGRSQNGGASIECFHSRGQHLCKFIRTKESICIRKEYNSQRIGLGHQYGRRDVM